MSFEDKRKALFACLDSAEKSIATDSMLHKDKRPEPSTDRDRQGRKYSESPDRRHGHQSSSIKKFRGRESIFKRPAAPIGKCLPSSRVPDFKKNPHKWTKYSLEDVDISDRSNTAAAFSFLRQIESQRRDSGIEHSEDDDVSNIDEDHEHRSQPKAQNEESGTQFRNRIKFNRSQKLKTQLEEEDRPPPETSSKAVVKGCRVLMPEYVVGQKPFKKSRNVVSKPTSSTSGSKRDRTKELKLDHLMDDDDDDEDEME
ncbi:protein TSSC4 [Uranotaenia lowii]|uniref:protein TSSC4 n=1 Tax=Uranotaenia lowii TaxID=190385 RepID=UPI00247988AE|nr:protein TSSC4 [Uranotaenia lowii]